MAALLRSARVIKFSPLGSLHIPGVKRSGPPLSRLYSGSNGGSRSACCSRKICPATEISLSRTWLCGVGCGRNYTVATVKKDDTSVAIQTKQAQDFDWALNKLDSSVRRTGRITKTLLLRIFHDICRRDYPSGNHALLLLRSCGTLLPEVPQEERTQLAHHVWDKLRDLGAQYDVSHYNALLKVYLQNEFKFSPTDFLAKMEAAKIYPNRVTYQRLIAAYCQNGDIEGASTILGFMKNKDLPITEAVFNSLVTGHARAGDIESAKNILTLMKNSGIDPGPETYISLLTAYAEKGDMDSFIKALEMAESADCTLMDRDFMQVIFSLAKTGHQQHIPGVAERLRRDIGYIPDAMNLCLSLITQHFEDTAFYILKSFPMMQSDNQTNDVGSFFLRHCVNMNMPMEKLGGYCKELQETNLHSSPLTFTLQCALESNNTVLSFELMKMLKEQGLPIRPHYFWPLLTRNLKDKNTDGVIEVLKVMKELGVTADVETFQNYILPTFPSMDAAQQALEDMGLSLESEAFVLSLIRKTAATDLVELANRLSDPSCPAVDLINFRGSLIQGFRKSSDVETMVKISALLYKDTRFSKDPADGMGYFLYNLIDSSSQEEVLAQEEKLKTFLTQLKAQNIMIPVSFFKGIRNLLQSYHIPQLIKYVAALVDQTHNYQEGSSFHAAGTHVKALDLEHQMEALIADNKHIGTTLKLLIQALCFEENLPRALELKEKHKEEMTVGSYVALINLCCRHDNVEEALNLKREISRKDSSTVLDTSKYINLVRALAKNGRIEEALDILKEMKEKDVVMDGSHVNMFFHLFHMLAMAGDSKAIKKMQDTLFTLGLTKPSSNLCSPLITSYLESEDLSGALDATIDCQDHYGVLPRIHDIIVGLVEKGDTELLQKAMNFLSQTRGEMAMLYELLFAFLQTGRYREARKIVETPGLRARPGRLQWYAEKCISANQMEPLEQLVDATAKLFDCDRDEMYSYVISLCKERNDWRKAEGVWTKMQEENVIPRERTLRMLADILRSNGEEVPFEVPETWYPPTTTNQEDKTKSVDEPAGASGDETAGASGDEPMPTNHAEYQLHLMRLCKKKKVKEAYRCLKDACKNGVDLSPSCYDQVIRKLLSEGSMEEAMEVKKLAKFHLPGFNLSVNASNLLIITQSKRGLGQEALESFKAMLSENQVPSHLAISRLVQVLGRGGDVDRISQVETLLKDLGASVYLSTMLFINNTALAHIKNGHVSSAVELLEGVYTRPDAIPSSMSFVFRKLLEEGNEEALDKLGAMAERLANHFACYRPASDLFLQLLDNDKVEDAKFLLVRCGALGEQRDALVSYAAEKSQAPGQGDRIKTLIDLIPNFTEKETLYSYLMKSHCMDKDLSSAKLLYAQMQEEGFPLDELSLKRLAVLYSSHRETAPFPEPPESFKFYADKLKGQVRHRETPEK